MLYFSHGHMLLLIACQHFCIFSVLFCFWFLFRSVYQYQEKPLVDSKTTFMSISYFGLKSKSFLFSMCQICAAVAALRNINSLSWPSSKKPAKALTLDILDWLQAMFGFQVIFLIDILSSNICHECLACHSNVRIPLSCRKIM